MLILFMLLKFESTVNTDGIWWRHQWKDNENINYLYLGNEMKRKDETCYQEVIYYADFDDGIKILINWRN